MSKQWVVGHADEYGAFIENDKGHDVVHVERLGRFVGDGTLNWVAPSLEQSEDARHHATTDEEWQAIIDLTAAAPEMLATLKNLRHLIGIGCGAPGIWAQGRLAEIDAVIAKAEPPRKVTHTVKVEVEVEVSMPPNAPAYVIEGLASGAVHFEADGLQKNVRLVSKRASVDGSVPPF